MNDDFADGLALGYILRNNKSGGGGTPVEGGGVFNDYLAGPEMMMLPAWIDEAPYSQGGSSNYYYISSSYSQYNNTMDRRMFNAFKKVHSIIQQYGSYPFAKIDGRYVNVGKAWFINYNKGPRQIDYSRATNLSANRGTYDMYKEYWSAYDPLNTNSSLNAGLYVYRHIYIQINNAGEPDEYPSYMYVTRWFNGSQSDIDYENNVSFSYSCERKIDILSRLVLWTPDDAVINDDEWYIWMQSNSAGSGYPPFSSQWQYVSYENTYLSNFK